MKAKKVIKPWGWELWYARTRHYVGKILVIKKGHRLSLQVHRQKHETIYTEKGSWILLLGRKKKRMREGDIAVIPPGRVHRFCAPYGDVRLLEASTPQVEDVIRLQDDYGRSR